MSEEVCVLLVAVEPSADELGAALAAALRRRLGDRLRLVGVGGPALAAEGLKTLFDPSAMAVVGAFNALAVYPTVLRLARRVGSLAAAERPDAAVLIDAWGFNLRAARAIRAAAPTTTIIKYVAPQVWATRPGRARTLARVADKLLTIHNFDAPWFERAGLSTTFVGNPVLDRDPGVAGDGGGFRTAHGLAEGDELLLLLPGSRAGEARRLKPVFRDLASRLALARPQLRLAIAPADSVAGAVQADIARWPKPPILVRGAASRAGAMKAASLAVACSGTVTTELAMAGCPMIVVYRLDPITYQIARRLIRTPHITLLNVAAGRAIAPERIQGACRGAVLEADVVRLLDDRRAMAAQIAAQTEALAVMRGGVSRPIEAAADAVLAQIAERRTMGAP
jgi:lipid-A-disaccharide synthase